MSKTSPALGKMVWPLTPLYISTGKLYYHLETFFSHYPIVITIPNIFRPDLINFEVLNPKYGSQNLTQAFTVAERELGIAPLLDPEGNF